MEHQVKIVIGANYGDEGKGLMSRYFTREFLKAGKTPATVFYNGSAQRGHTADYEDGTRHVFHNFCAGAKEGGITYYAPTFLVHPMDYCRELDELDYLPLVSCSPECAIVTPLDMLADQIIVDFQEATTGIREYKSCCYGSWSATDRIRSRASSRGQLMRVGQYKGRDYSSWQRDMIQWFNYRLNAYGVDANMVPRWKNYINGKSALRGLLYHFKADMDRFMDTVSFRTFPDIMGDYTSIIFEGAQGLMLGRGLGGDCSTTSWTGMTTPRTLLEVYRRFEAEVCYVTRTYLTRHGDGLLPGECDKSVIPNMVDNVVDKTNVWNPFQGSLRYAPLDIDTLHERIKSDFRSDWMRQNGQYTPTIALTHCNEVDIPVFGETYRSYNPCEVIEVMNK